ncbi:unnamed protein product [Fusarium venenatum]|uniref:Methyltransferase type 11 domain-containing protein n=2 Tax=Fusarium venenatum TaxID=56646 RepID=A0A2L2T1B3_9HYPO|nr:uncharacterized protein FVRRES_07615 [Fusarium venenatum]CEI63179.1 unnamed protein product [Fusarium venenatum]
MESEPRAPPALALPPAPMPAWEVLQNLQQLRQVRCPRVQLNQDEGQESDHDMTDEGFDDHDDSDMDSALGSNLADSTYSLSSSIFDYRTLHGRTYHSDRGTAQYWASNDDQASESLDLAHHFTLLLLEDKLHLAPLDSHISVGYSDSDVKFMWLTNVLGRGFLTLEQELVSRPIINSNSGTDLSIAIWAIDFADEHPGVEVVGTEISPIQPTWMPPNLRLEIEDANDSWTFNPDSFDFVHMRFMLGSITDWTATFSEAYTACVPGGWVESYEVSSTMESDDNSIPDGSAMQRWGEVFEEGGQRAGRSFSMIQEDVQRKSMEEAGFVNIHVVDLKAPFGGWHTEERLKQVGIYMQAALERDYEGYLLFLACELLGWTEDRVRDLCTQLRLTIAYKSHLSQMPPLLPKPVTSCHKPQCSRSWTGFDLYCEFDQQTAVSSNTPDLISINGQLIEKVHQIGLQLYDFEVFTLDPDMVREIAKRSDNDIRSVFIAHDKRILSIIHRELHDLVHKHKIISQDQRRILAECIIPTIVPGSPELQTVIENASQDPSIKDQFIIKPFRLARGLGIRLGKDISAKEWQSILQLMKKAEIDSSMTQYLLQPLLPLQTVE